MARSSHAPQPSTAEETRAPTAEEVEIAVRVLEALEADRSRLTDLDRAQRQALLVAAGRLSKPDRAAQRALSKAFRRKDRTEAQAEDRRLLEETALRKERRAEVFRPLWVEPGPEREKELNQERACYVCKQPYRSVHFFYDSMCRSCGDFNYGKRSQSVPLHGRTCLVTGARVKIGYQASLMLLRAGARVLATTRFPRDAARRYAREEDFEAWKDRLVVYGLDLRHTPSVELFTRQVLDTEERLDLLLNNACQTVRRPPGWYAHLIPDEEKALGPSESHLRPLLEGHEALAGRLRAAPAPAGGQALAPLDAHAPGVGVWASAALSQKRYLDEDFTAGVEVFPQGALDADLQQVDLRDVNSWRLTMAEVSAAELLEVHLVNAVAPFVLNARLKPLLLRGNEARDRHVVNVSAMEGQFYRAKKTDRHPHTNMAKAALNMMTRTSAADYAKDGVWMNAVDTGWITDEDPAVHAARKAEQGFTPPLDIVDGAARILDPFFVGLQTGQHPFGQFFKDYRPAPW